jgi:glycine/D-amino acid oxidase-like deaminating enzyme
MKAIVIGAGAWGLPAAAELVRRGHDVALIDRHSVGNRFSSSLGPTRMWRLADPEPLRVRLGTRAVDAMRRLNDRSKSTVFLRRGVLWRDDESLPKLASTLQECGIDYTEVQPGDVAKYLPGLRPDGRAAIWQDNAGIVLAAELLSAQHRLFVAGGGAELIGRTVTGVEVTATGVRVSTSDDAELNADAVVLAAGPGTPGLLAHLGVNLPLQPYLEQVVHFGDRAQPHATDDFPCLFDGPRETTPGIYAMPSPGIGYKVGLDTPLRPFDEADPDRTPDPDRTAELRSRVCRDLTAVTPTVVDAQICSWTDSPDGAFVIDALADGLVLACGDSGEGFKMSALVGEVLADLAEGLTPDRDVAALSMKRFAGGMPGRAGPHVLGRH